MVWYGVVCVRLQRQLSVGGYYIRCTDFTSTKHCDDVQKKKPTSQRFISHNYTETKVAVDERKQKATAKHEHETMWW